MELPDISKYTKEATIRNYKKQLEYENANEYTLESDQMKTFYVPDNNKKLFSLGKLNNQIKKIQKVKDQEEKIKIIQEIQKKTVISNSPNKNFLITEQPYINPEKFNICITEPTKHTRSKKKPKKVDHIQMFTNTENKSIREFINKTRKIVEIKYSINLKKEREKRMKEFDRNYKEAIESSVKAIQLSWHQFNNDFLDKFETYVKSMNYIKELELNKLNQLKNQLNEIESKKKIEESKSSKLVEKLNQLIEYKKFLICVKMNISKFPESLQVTKTTFKDLTSDNDFSIFKHLIPQRFINNKETLKLTKSTTKLLDSTKNLSVVPTSKEKFDRSTCSLERTPGKERKSSINFKKQKRKQTVSKKTAESEKITKIKELFSSNKPIFNSPDELKNEINKLEKINLELLKVNTDLMKQSLKIQTEVSNQNNSENKPENYFDSDYDKKLKEIEELKLKNKSLQEYKIKALLEKEEKPRKENSNFNILIKFFSKNEFYLKILEIYKNCNEYTRSLDKNNRLYNPDVVSNVYSNFLLHNKDKKNILDEDVNIIIQRIEMVFDSLSSKLLVLKLKLPTSYFNSVMKDLLLEGKKKRNKKEKEANRKKKEDLDKLILEKTNRLYIKQKKKIPMKVKPFEEIGAEELIKKKQEQENLENDFKNLLFFNKID